jgi:hypothetical protein
MRLLHPAQKKFVTSIWGAGLANLGGLLTPLALAAPALAGEPLPKSGPAKLAAYAVCRSLAIVDLGPAGANPSAERISIGRPGTGRGF